MLYTLRQMGMYILKSLGIMKVTMTYLSPHEQLNMQQICKWYYTTGVGRTQTKIVLFEIKYFSNPYPNRYARYLLAYTVGEKLIEIKCTNMAAYNSFNWYSCQMGERIVF